MISVGREFEKTITEQGEWQYSIIRHMSDVKCVCITQPPMVYDSVRKAEIPNPSFRTTPNPECSNCGGSGYIFEEFLHKALMFYPGFRFAHFEDMQVAITEENMLTVYLQATDDNLKNISINDWLFFLKSDVNGRLIQPLVRSKKWLINDIQPIKLDSNRLEYIKVYVKPSII